LKSTAASGTDKSAPAHHPRAAWPVLHHHALGFPNHASSSQELGAWYPKQLLTLGDAIAVVRRQI
jgi:hypothetical protein